MESLIAKLKSLNSASVQDIEMLKGMFKEVEFRKGWILSNPAWKTKPMLYFISAGLIKVTVTYRDDFLTL